MYRVIKKSEAISHAFDCPHLSKTCSSVDNQTHVIWPHVEESQLSARDQPTWLGHIKRCTIFPRLPNSRMRVPVDKNCPRWGWYPSNFRNFFTTKKTIVFGLPFGVNRFCWNYTTTRQTDGRGRTEGLTNSITATCITAFSRSDARGKNSVTLMSVDTH